MRLKEAREEAAEIYRIAGDPRAVAKDLQHPALTVAPVYAEAEVPAPPAQRFTFRDPALGPSRGRGRGRSDERARQGRGLPRKSRPHREVGSGRRTPDGNESENSEVSHPELEEASSDDENDEQPPENWEDEEVEEEEEENVNAPLGSVSQREWGEWYGKCPRWGQFWQDMSGTGDWPPGTQVVDQRMFLDGKPCIPTPLQREWIRKIHEQIGHVGFERTWKILGRDFEWGDVHVAQNFARQVSHECDTCQACDRPRNKFGPIVFAPIPPVTMLRG